MTLTEAIEILTEGTDANITASVQDEEAATKLLIEAGKRVEKYRPLYAGKHPHLLPGESKE